MTTNTPNLSLVLYDNGADASLTFNAFRTDIAGTAVTSNFYKIDTAIGTNTTNIGTNTTNIGTHTSQIASLMNGKTAVLVSAIRSSPGVYAKTGLTEVVSYVTGMSIILKLDITSTGATTLNINSLGAKSVMKVNTAGTHVDITGGELVASKYYLFIYDGTRFVWVGATVGDQIYIAGTSGNIVTVGSDNTILGTTAMIVKASGAELDTGTDDAKFSTSKAIKDSHNVPSVIPSTSGNVMTSNGTDWVSSSVSVTATNTVTLTNKAITRRVTSSANYTTNTGTSLNCDTTDVFIITAQAGALLFNSPSGTPTQSQPLVIRIKDNGTARALTWNAIFRAIGTALPTTTVLSKTLYLGFFYNSTDTKWDLVAEAQQA